MPQLTGKRVLKKKVIKTKKKKPKLQAADLQLHRAKRKRGRFLLEILLKEEKEGILSVVESA